ncbi:ribonucleotide-diphosphate reductase subunit beta [Nocardiopsis terrae]
MTRWTPLLLDEATLSDMSGLPSEAVLRHAESVIDGNPKPVELYQRWERQQWSAEDLNLARDREELRRRLPARYRKLVEESIATFIIGEYTGLDMLGPILTGSPDEHYSVFLGTQIADETRHTRAVFRMGAEVLDMDPDPKRMLERSWRMVTTSHRELSLLEAGIVRNLNDSPMSYGQWLKAVTLFHLITEGVLALVGQRVMVQSLRDMDLLPGIKSAFTAMCRDESRHIGFGLHALSTGMKEGHQEDIYEVLEQAVPLAFGIDKEIPGSGNELFDSSIRILRRHLTTIGVESLFQEHLLSLVGKNTESASAAN